MKVKRLVAAVSVLVVGMTTLSFQNSVYGEEKDVKTKVAKTITIDGNKIDTSENNKYRGLGMVTGNNSSRLLLDYKTEHEEEYWKIMNALFNPDTGMGLGHIKIEMGSDINSSSGTEPAVKRSKEEKADVTRGAGYQIAADAKTINKDITLDMLWWSEPAWVRDSEDVYAARYAWYKETLDAAYDTYQLQFDYVSATQNEKPIDPDWIKYLSKKLKEEKSERYDYSKIKIVSSDEVTSWSTADQMLEDKELMDAIDVIGSHYTSFSSETAKKIKEEENKELWFSEGSSPMSYSKSTYKYDGTGSGLSDINGMLDIATRIITAESKGSMNLYEFQPTVAAYYNGATYFQKQEITANEPWSGYYEVDAGYYMALQFSLFAKNGWQFVKDASFGDGEIGGDGHALINSTYNYLTVANKETGDYSTIIANNSAKTIEYTLDVRNFDKSKEGMDVWESRGADQDSTSYYDNFLQKTETITPKADGDKSTYTVTVKPYSMVTLTTLKVERPVIEQPEQEKSVMLSLPYSDDFEYKEYAADYLEKRGNAPRYTTDQSGAFEVRKLENNNVLEQKITYENKASEWGGGRRDPITCLGDDNWMNYSVSTEVLLAKSNSEGTTKNYVGIGARYNLQDAGNSGYQLRIMEDGSWCLMYNDEEIKNGTIEDFDKTKWNTLKLSVNENKINGYINDKEVVSYKAQDTINTSGRIALYSDFNTNQYDNIKVEPIEGAITNSVRVDNMDDGVSYEGSWEHETMSSFRNYNRTVSSTNVEGAKLSFEFYGQGFACIGVCEDAVINVMVDGKSVKTDYKIPTNTSRSASYYLYGLEEGQHAVIITVKSGNFSVDAIEIARDTIYKKQTVVGTKDMTMKTMEPSKEPSKTEAQAQEASASETKESSSTNMVVMIAVAVAVVVALAAIVTVVIRRKKKA